jgi:3-isopropylmalate dehydrogenase
MKLNIAVLAGDGIGPEVTKQAQNVLNAIAKEYQHEFKYQNALVGAAAIDHSGDPLPEETIKIVQNADAVLFGAIGDPKYDNDPAAKVRPEQGLLKLRKILGLYANVRPVQAFKPLLHHSNLKEEVIEGVDFVIYRELTGGIYFGEKKKSEDGKTASDLCEYATYEIARILHPAFKAAMQRNKKLTLVDKANVLETSRLWRSVAKEIAKEYPEVQLDFLFVDNAAMQIILNPKQFDVMVTENMFGDILSDEASVIAGSIGLLASASIGDASALFEPIHGSYPQATGKNIANPLAAILSAAMLLEHFGLQEEADSIKLAVEKSIEDGVSTPDINKENPKTTVEVGEYVVNYIRGNIICKKSNENISLGQSTII